jgi:hypothetical protein
MNSTNKNFFKKVKVTEYKVRNEIAKRCGKVKEIRIIL